ncbi:MAG: hypothetical protein HZC28_08935 [Spirochaetes bacterium]|nr:hypothetical protein [Spirochaetota bacterium]
MTLTKTTIIGFCEAVADFMQTNRSTLMERNADIDRIISELRKKSDDALAECSGHEILAVKLRESTARTDAAVAEAYNAASAAVDITAGLVGKTTELGHQTARLRSRIIRRRSSE